MSMANLGDVPPLARVESNFGPSSDKVLHQIQAVKNVRKWRQNLVDRKFPRSLRFGMMIGDYPSPKE